VSSSLEREGLRVDGRTVAIHRGEAINEEAFVAMFRAIIAHNRAGGWRKIMRER
jgi:hypothetical protein